MRVYYFFVTVTYLLVSLVEFLNFKMKIKYIKEIIVYVTLIFLSLISSYFLIAEVEFPSIAHLIAEGLSMVVGGATFEK